MPIALAHPDRSIRKMTKSMLMLFLEKDVNSCSSLPASQYTSACLIDAMALIQMVKSAGCATYLELSKKYEEILLATLSRPGCTRVDLIFGQYPSVSVKADERRKRGESSSLEVIIHSGSTRVPKQWATYISRTKKTWLKTKENLAEFLCDALSKQLPQHLSSSQKVVLAGGFRDGSKTAS